MKRKYVMVGTFINGAQWEEPFQGEKEMDYVLDKVFDNEAIVKDSIVIFTADKTICVWKRGVGFLYPHQKYMERLLRDIQ